MKTLIALIFFIISFATTAVVLAVIHERVPDQGTYDPLSDAILDIIPEKFWAIDVCEVIILTSVVTSISFILIFHKHRFIVLRRAFVITGLLYFMRCLTMFVTVLPVATSQKYCASKLNNTDIAVVTKRAWYLATGFGLSINGKHNLCGDSIYSGHTVILCMVSLMVAEYTPQKLYIIHWFSWIITLVGVVMVLWAHAHYTVDIIIAYYATTRIFWVYHTFANTELKQKCTNNYLSRVWWFPVFQYFEKNVGAPIPAQYEWPFSWPRKREDLV
jgi:shingomyelin synthase